MLGPLGGIPVVYIMLRPQTDLHHASAAGKHSSGLHHASAAERHSSGLQRASADGGHSNGLQTCVEESDDTKKGLEFLVAGCPVPEFDGKYVFHHADEKNKYKIWRKVIGDGDAYLWYRVKSGDWTLSHSDQCANSKIAYV